MSSTEGRKSDPMWMPHLGGCDELRLERRQIGAV